MIAMRVPAKAAAHREPRPLGRWALTSCAWWRAGREETRMIAIPGLSAYGITTEQYCRLEELQRGQCAVCGTEDYGVSHAKRFAVDHDHGCCPGSRSCGRCVRGLLCTRCNTLLERARDDPAVLAAAIAYLYRYRRVRHARDLMGE